MSKPLQTIPSRYYTDPEYYRIEKGKIFYCTWQFVCHETDIAEPGAYRTVQIADESIVVLRDHDGHIRAFYNVCRHRAHRIVEGSGNCSRLVCPYHAWVYNLDGSLAKARGTEEIAGFDPKSVRLSPVRVESFCGLVFVNLDDESVCLDDLYPDLREELLNIIPGLSNLIRVHEDCIVHDCNWKVSVENFSECYHCPVAHKYVTTNLYSGTEYRISTGKGYVRHYSPGLRDQEANGDLHIWMLWPNFAILTYPIYRSVSFRLFQSLGPRTTAYTYFMFIDPGLTDAQRKEVVEYGGTVYHSNNAIEDGNIVRNVQLGLESRSYNQGHLVVTPTPSAESEIGVAYFQNRYLEEIEKA